jgi:hypothetical protein
MSEGQKPNYYDRMVVGIVRDKNELPIHLLAQAELVLTHKGEVIKDRYGVMDKSPTPVDNSKTIEKYVARLKKIYNERTAVDTTFEGVLYSFFREMVDEKPKQCQYCGTQIYKSNAGGIGDNYWQSITGRITCYAFGTSRPHQPEGE